MTTKYLSTAETAKLVRVALKAAFPAVKFSVTSKSYSGGSSISVRWTDGPSAKRVDAVVGPFEGGGFDGSIDLAYNVYAWVLNGEIVGTKSHGTAGSMGVVSAWGLIPPHDDAELVSFGTSTIHTDRTISPALARKASALVSSYYGVQMPAIVEYVGWNKQAAWKLENDNRVMLGSWHGEFPSTLIYQAATDRSRFQRHSL